MKDNNTVLTQTQRERDNELCALCNVSLEEVESNKIASPKTIMIHKGENIPASEEAMSDLYSYPQHLDWVGYLRTLMYTSVYKRGGLISFLKKQKGKKCLDYGCGTATHSIILGENGNDINILEVQGQMLFFAVKRLLLHNIPSKSFEHQDILPSNTFDLVLCVEVLEHVHSPKRVIESIHDSMISNGQLYLRYSTMVKNSSGHFASNIIKIKKDVIPFLEKNFNKTDKYVYSKK